MIKSRDMVHEYYRRDEQNNVISIERALDGVSLDVRPGEFISIVGHNGSGKSTLAKHLNALLVPTEGTLQVNGLDTNDEMNTLSIRKSTGMVFQNPDNQIVANVVEEDVAFGPENVGVPTQEIWKRVEHALNTVDMAKRRKDSPNHLSGGQKQRVAIAGVLAMRPRCIVLDEPTAMLDPDGRREVLQAVLDLNREEKITIILITHFMEEVIHSDRIFVMNKGKLMLQGTPEYIFSKVEELQEYHLEVPQATYISHLLKKSGFQFESTILTTEQLVRSLCQKEVSVCK